VHCTVVGVEKKDSEMESGIESDQDDDHSSLNDATRAAAAAATSIDELIESLTVPPPPSHISSSVDIDLLSQLSRLARAPPPSSPVTSRLTVAKYLNDKYRIRE